MIRWDLDTHGCKMEKSANGEYVEYEVAMKEISQLKQEIEQLKAELTKAEEWIDSYC